MSTLPETIQDEPAPSKAALALAALAVLLALALAVHGPIAQWPTYHDFADQRSGFGIPNLADVLSNLPFAIVGIWGLTATSLSAGWRLFAFALLATAAGSAFYHWAPGNGALVFDRLPIAWACAALLCSFLAERVDPRWARPAVLGAALLVASASVGLWWLSEVLGRSDLRAYLFVQFLPMLLVPAALLLRLPVRTPRCLADRAWWLLLAGYAAAKGFELADQAVFDALGLVSGHTLKHLVAAAAAGWVVRAAISSGSRR